MTDKKIKTAEKGTKLDAKRRAKMEADPRFLRQAIESGVGGDPKSKLMALFEEYGVYWEHRFIKSKPSFD